MGSGSRLGISYSGVTFRTPRSSLRQLWKVDGGTLDNTVYCTPSLPIISRASCFRKRAVSETIHVGEPRLGMAGVAMWIAGEAAIPKLATHRRHTVTIWPARGGRGWDVRCDLTNKGHPTVSEHRGCGVQWPGHAHHGPGSVQGGSRCLRPLEDDAAVEQNTGHPMRAEDGLTKGAFRS